MSLSASLDSLILLAKQYEDDLREARRQIERLEADNEEMRKEHTVILHDEEIMECDHELARRRNEDRPQGGLFSFLFTDKK